MCSQQFYNKGVIPLHQYGPKSLRNVFRTTWKVSYEELSKRGSNLLLAPDKVAGECKGVSFDLSFLIIYIHVTASKTMLTNIEYISC